MLQLKNRKHFHFAALLAAALAARCEPVIPVELNQLLGKPSLASKKSLVALPESLSSRKILVLGETKTAFEAMAQAAAKDRINLRVISGYRSFSHQKRIWEAKFTGARKVGNQDLSKTMPNHVERSLKILQYSSMPGTSRHHWGTDIDINQLENSYFEKGQGLKEYQWLQKNAGRFGFCQVYSDKAKGRSGYEEEKWHWSYMPIAKVYLEEYLRRVGYDNIQGFKGSKAGKKIDVITKYVAGISKQCLNNF